jgi:hypothetical protein
MAKRKVKVFLDSNVIISGLISVKATPRLILDLLCYELPFMLAATGQFNVLINPPPMVEDPKRFHLYQGFKAVLG